MVLLSKSSTDYEVLWNTVGGVNDAPQDKHLSPVSNIIAEGQFRSSVVDEWATMNYEEVSLVGMNTLGDPLWTTVFNASGTTFEMSSWLSNSTFLSSPAVSTDEQLVITRDSNYALRLQPATQPDRAWFVITDRSLYTYGSLPVFYAAKNPSVPFLFPDLPQGHLGCWTTSVFVNFTLMYDASATSDNTPEMCIDVCDGYNAAVLLQASKCYCGLYTAPATPTPSYCVRTCPGDTSQMCGGYFATYGNVYHLQGDTTPGEMKTEQIYQVDHTGAGTSLQLDWVDIVASPTDPCVYVTAVTISASVTATFSFTYSHTDCSSATPEETLTFRNGSSEVFPISSLEMPVDILCLRCITFSFSVALPTVTVALYGPIDSLEHIQAPVVAVQAKRTLPDTTTTSTTTSTTSTTTSATTSTTSTTSTTPTTTSTTSTTTSTTTPATTSTTSTTTSTTPTTTTPTTTLTTPTTTSTASTTPTTTSTTPTPIATTSTTQTSTSATPTSTSTASTTTPPPSASTASTTTITTTTSSTPTTVSTTTSTPLTLTTTTKPSTSSSQSQSETTEGSTSSTASETTTSACKCPCNNYTKVLNMSAEELREKVLAIQKKLAVNVSELSSTIRKLTSAEDNRPSAMSIGFLGISLLTGVFGTIFLIDATTLFRDLKKLVNNIKAGFCQQDVVPT